MPNTYRMVQGKRVAGTMNQRGVKDGDPSWAAQAWDVTLRCEGRTMRFPFYGGGMADPNIDKVVEALEIDTSYDDDTFEDFCGNLGYDTDSREAERTWKAVRKQSARFAKLLGS